MTGLHQTIRRTIRRHALCPPGSGLLIALSGGSDSVALTLLMQELAEHGGFAIVGLAHLNHGLRPTAVRDEHFCRELASRQGLPLAVEAVSVRDYAAAQRLSVETAARRLRYEFLERSAARCGADRIAIGHTQDDQAETFLLKLIRGAGLTGLGAVYPSHGRVIRPLLDVSRAELREYLLGCGETWVDDETNDDLDNPRNRVRHRVLPGLECANRGAVRPAIARSAALAREDGQWLDELAAARFVALVTTGPTGAEIDAAGLAAEPPPVRRRVLLAAMRAQAGGREIGLEHVQAAMDLLAGWGGGIDVPGSRVELRRGKLVLVQQGRR